MDPNAIPEELKVRAQACKNADELAELAESEGIELTDEELEGISGGTVLWGDCPDDNYTPY